MIFTQIIVCAPENRKLKKYKGKAFYVSEVISNFSLCITGADDFGLLQYYIAALHLFNIIATFCLSNLSKYAHRYSNLLLNTKLTYYSVVLNFCMPSFACVLVCLYVCLCCLLHKFAACICKLAGAALNKIHTKF